MSWFIVIFFGAGITACLGISAYFYSRSNSARRSAAFLDRVSGGLEAQSDLVELDDKPSRLSKNKSIQKMLRDAPFAAEAAALLDQSGLPTTVAGLLVQMAGFFLVIMVFALVLGLEVAAAFFIGAGMASMPVLFVIRARQRRSIAFEAQLPQALELIGLYLRSGRSLPQAFIGATEEITPPAAEEFMSAAEEYRLGRPLDVSLKRLAMKYPTSLGFRLFAIAVSVLGQTGGNLVEVLERIKKTLDAGVTYGLRLKALTGESRMSAWILGILPGFFLLLTAALNPVYFNAFFNFTMGRLLFGIFLFFWGMGILWIRNLMNSKLM